MNLDDQLRAVLDEEAGMRIASPPNVEGMISGGKARRRRRNAVRAGGGVLAAVIAVGGLYGLTQIGDGEADSQGLIATTPTPEALPTFAEPEAITAGTYLVPAGNGEVAPYTVTVPAGWAAQYGDSLSKHPDEPSGVGIGTFALDEIGLFDDACHGPGILGTARSSTANLVTALRRQVAGPKVSHPVATTLAALPATRIDLDQPARVSGCRLGRQILQVWRQIPQPADDYFVLFPDSSASVYVVDVDGRAQVFVVQTGDEISAADRAELQSVLDSISFRTGAQ
jgi:hypothetical protein